MTTESLSHMNPEDIFAKAIERVEAGETVEAVLVTVPEPSRAELREVLLLVSATHHLQRAPVPQPATPRRAERKRAFLEAAAQMKAATALPPTPITTPVVVSAPKAQPVPAQAPWWAALANFWHDLQASFTAPNLRLAPLLTMLAVVFLAAFGFERAASAAAIGEPAYMVKQWLRDQKFNLSSAAQRPYVYIENLQGLKEDIEAATAEIQSAAVAGPQVAPRSTERLVFDRLAGDYLVSGDLRILLRYQPDLNTERYVTIDMPVTPEAGQFIDVTFQVVPNKDATNGSPFILQGIALVIPAVQPAMDPTPAALCKQSLPDGWIPYGVRAGDTLSAIAERTGTTVAQLQQANCLFDADLIPAGKSINAPKPPPTNTPTASVPTLAATLTAISTTVLTPSIDITPGSTVVPTATTPIAETPPAMTATVAPTGTSVITDPISQTPTAVETPTPPISVTLTATSEPTTDGTLTATPVAPTTSTITPEAGTPPAPTETTTPPPAVTTTATAITDATPTPTAPSPTVAVTETTPAVADTPTPDPLPTATTASGGGQGGSSTETPPPPTSDANQGGSGGGSSGDAPTPTNTPIPQNKSPLTGG